jgi:hypothetical protein
MSWLTGPVFIELPTDILYSYSLISKEFLKEVRALYIY